METLKRIDRKDAVAYDFEVAEPQLRVAQGEQFVVETRDSPNGGIKSTSDLFNYETLGEVFSKGILNPCAGPIYVEGAEPGDTLIVDIIDIKPAVTGFVSTEGGLGPLHGTKHPELQHDFTEMVEHRPGPSGTFADGTAHLTNGTSWNLEPMIGALGVAPPLPERGNDTLSMQNEYGGCYDSTDFKAGHRIHLPVAHSGAMLYVGDVQSSQGVEFAGSAVEVDAEVTLSCTVVKNKQAPFVRVETPTHLIQMTSHRDWSVATEKGFLMLLDWLVEDYGLDPRKVVTHLNGNPEVQARIYGVSTCSTCSIGVRFPKDAIAGSRR